MPGCERVLYVQSTAGVRAKRVYEQPEPGDGLRVLVDRLWPRGLSKDAAALDDWCKQITPSSELRTWYGHRPDRFEEFAARYKAELEEPDRAAALAALAESSRSERVTLLTATKDLDSSHVTVLMGLIADLVG